MRKFLALVLALVMTMSLVTVSAGAATAFADDADITNEEAVEVLNAMGVLTGNNGKFNPAGKLTRGAGAKIIAYLMLGQAKADKLTATYTVFEDVTDGVGLAAYIEWAAANNIVGGYGDGKFGPYDTLTEYAFGKMLLAALGYKAAEEGYTGAGWQKNVYADALTAGIYDGTETYGACTRDTAARMALGALKANIVYYGSATTADDYIWNGHKLEGVEATTTVVGAIESATPLWDTYAGLQYIALGLDTFGRPGHYWSYGDFSKFYMNAPVAEYTEATTLCDIMVDLGLSESSKKDIDLINVITNGTLNDTTYVGCDHIDGTCASTAIGDQGVLTQVFKVGANNIVTVIDTYLTFVTDVNKAYHNTKGNTELTAYYNAAGDDKANNDTAYEIIANGNMGYAKGTALLAQASLITDADVPAFVSDAAALADLEDEEVIALDAYDYTEVRTADEDFTYVGVVGEPSVIASGKYTGVSTAQSKAKVNGTWTATNKNYELSECELIPGVDNANFGRYDFFVDQYGNLIGDALYNAPYTYAVIQGLAHEQADIDEDDYVRTLLINPSAEKVKVDMYQFAGEAVTMSPSGDATAAVDGAFSREDEDNVAYYDYAAKLGLVKVYELATGYNLVPVAVEGTIVAVGADQDVAIDKGVPTFNGESTDEDTIFVVKYLDANKKAAYKSYTGYENVPSMENVSYVAVYDTAGDFDGEYADFVYVDLTLEDHEGYFVSDNDVAFVLNTASTGWDADLNLFTYDVVIGGKVVEVTSEDDALFDAVGAWELKYDAEEHVLTADKLFAVDADEDLVIGTAPAFDGTDVAANWGSATITGKTTKVVSMSNVDLLFADAEVYVLNFVDVNENDELTADDVLVDVAADGELAVGAQVIYGTNAAGTKVTTVFVLNPMGV